MRPKHCCKIQKFSRITQVLKSSWVYSGRSPTLNFLRGPGSIIIVRDPLIINFVVQRFSCTLLACLSILLIIRWFEITFPELIPGVTNPDTSLSSNTLCSLSRRRLVSNSVCCGPRQSRRDSHYPALYNHQL